MQTDEWAPPVRYAKCILNTQTDFAQCKLYINNKSGLELCHRPWVAACTLLLDDHAALGRGRTRRSSPSTCR